MRISIYGTELTDGDDGVFVVLRWFGEGLSSGALLLGSLFVFTEKSKLVVVMESCLVGLGFFSRGVNELIFSRRFIIINPTVVLQQYDYHSHSFNVRCVLCG